jgi:hypothetical protein
MTLYCVVCRSEIADKRARRNASTCSRRCQAELKRMKTEAEREDLAGNTCPTCARYVPLNSTERALVESTRFVAALGEGNNGRFV